MNMISTVISTPNLIIEEARIDRMRCYSNPPIDINEWNGSL